MVWVVPLGTPTGALPWELSASRFAEVSAALRSRERRLQTVAEREPQLRRQRRVVLVPVREERGDVATQLAEEPADGHIPPPSPWYVSTGSCRSSGSSSFLRHGLTVSV
jgi:hypothetical protein